MKEHVIDVSDECYAEIRKALIALGDGGTFLERPGDRRIDMGGVVVRNGFVNQETYQHKASGRKGYKLLKTAQVQVPDDAPLTDYEVVQVYKDKDGGWWVRRAPEFREKFKREV